MHLSELRQKASLLFRLIFSSANDDSAGSDLRSTLPLEISHKVVRQLPSILVHSKCLQAEAQVRVTSSHIRRFRSVIMQRF